MLVELDVTVSSMSLIAFLSRSVMAGKYKVSFQRINNNQPVLTSQGPNQSSFKWNYNTAVVPDPSYNSFGLLVRAQNQLRPNDPYSTTPSVMPLTKFQGILNASINTLSFDPITESSVVFKSEQTDENFGVEDPRIVYRGKTGEYYLLYTAAEEYDNGTVIARLALAVTTTPEEAGSWQRLGVLFPDEAWSKRYRSPKLLHLVFIRKLIGWF